MTTIWLHATVTATGRGASLQTLVKHEAVYCLSKSTNQNIISLYEIIT